ncbi:hypothetical protein V2J09_005258 [Rumex salicifolius]
MKDSDYCQIQVKQSDPKLIKDEKQTFSEVSLEPPWNIAKIPHAASSSGLSPYCFHTPVVCKSEKKQGRIKTKDGNLLLVDKAI